MIWSLQPVKTKKVKYSVLSHDWLEIQNQGIAIKNFPIKNHSDKGNFHLAFMADKEHKDQHLVLTTDALRSQDAEFI